MLTLATWAVIAEEAGWIASGEWTPWVPKGFLLGGVMVAVGLLMGGLASVAHKTRAGRCVRCGVRIEKSQTYCHDHLRETVNETRDRLYEERGLR